VCSSDLFNGGSIPVYARLSDGTLVLPSMNGFVLVNPYGENQQLPDGQIFISSLKADESFIPFSESLLFSQKSYRFVFKVQAPYFGNPYNQNFEYRLNNEAAGIWKGIEGDELVLGRFAPGTYELQIRKHQGFGMPHVVKSVYIEVPRYYYQNWWFYALLAMALIAMLLAIYKFRIRFLNRQREVLQNLVRERGRQLQEIIADLRFYNDQIKKQYLTSQQVIDILAHDIRSPLKYLDLTLSDIQQNDLVQNDGAMLEDLNITRETCQNLSAYVNQILEIRKKESLETIGVGQLDVRTFFESKAGLFRGMMAVKNIEFQNLVPEGTLIRINKHLFSVIFQNLLDNAIKNTNSGKVTVVVNSHPEGFEVNIQDEGPGLPEEVLTAINQGLEGKKELTNLGHGLQMVLELTNLLNADVSAKNLPKGGTQIAINFIEAI